jgi:hypothetical protein
VRRAAGRYLESTGCAAAGFRSSALVERKVRVSLVGNGPNEQGLCRIVEQLTLTNVDFRGYSDDVEKIWGGASRPCASVSV